MTTAVGGAVGWATEEEPTRPRLEGSGPRVPPAAEKFDEDEAPTTRIVYYGLRRPRVGGGFEYVARGGHYCNDENIAVRYVSREEAQAHAWPLEEVFPIKPVPPAEKP